MNLNELAEYLRAFQVPESLKELKERVRELDVGEKDPGTAFVKVLNHIQNSGISEDVQQLALTAYAKLYESQMQQIQKTTDEKNSIGKKIRSYRLEHNLSQIQLAERLGVSNKTISKWERGEGLPDLAYIVPLAEVFGVSTDVLLGR